MQYQLSSAVSRHRLAWGSSFSGISPSKTKRQRCEPLLTCTCIRGRFEGDVGDLGDGIVHPGESIVMDNECLIVLPHLHLQVACFPRPTTSLAMSAPVSEHNDWPGIGSWTSEVELEIKLSESADSCNSNSALFERAMKRSRRSAWNSRLFSALLQIINRYVSVCSYVLKCH